VAAPTFESVLVPPETLSSAVRQDDAYFADLHLDDIVARLTAGREAYDLVPFFQEPLADVAAVTYRHEVFRDLEDEQVLHAVLDFTKGMVQARELRDRSGRVRYQYERERWFLDAAAVYREAVDEFGTALARMPLQSRGLKGFAAHLAAYRESSTFGQLELDIQAMDAQLATVLYTLHIDSGRITVARSAGEPDYGAEVLDAFARFQQGDETDFRFSVPFSPEMNHVEAAILDRVALLFPEVFGRLDEFCAAHVEFADPTILQFDREIQFFVAYLELVGRLRIAGLPFCHPQIGEAADGAEAHDVFDLALAPGLLAENVPVVVNDFELGRGERIIVVSGPNQGGKTTFARTFGQIHHLARIGVPVPGSSARLPLADAIFSHFEREERVEDLTGKLEGDLRRIRIVLERVTAASVVVMNESFSSTTLEDQLYINERVLRALVERGCLAVAVTFLDELASLDPAMVSMVSTVDPEEPARRTFKIVRRAADGLAYAMSIAEKHGLTGALVRARLAR
jgi:DNA mismatch repair protein MutS